MMQSPDAVKQKITAAPNARRWLVTGAAGFIGSNLVEALLRLDQSVVGIDSFATGSKANLAEIQAAVAPAQWGKFSFIEGDITDLAACRAACEGVSIVLHEAAIGSVPRSIDEPLATHAANVTGHLNMLIAAKDAAVD
ncbi:MAG TPA: NAD-dependent epimerase/dehydratase family protein, partial [Phycisphaerales bacterium]|nr:NAD-dependent epimerase/dehydratase family protein [Phycisphaerales bacterium]